MTLELDTKLHSVIAIYNADIFACIDLCNADTFHQMWNNTQSHATAFAVRVSPVEAPTSCSMMHAGTGHPFFHLGSLFWLFNCIYLHVKWV